MFGEFIKRTRDRIIWSWAGCKDAWTNEHSFRSWVWANAGSALLVLILPLSTGERALILSLGILVLAAELFNTAIEHTVDLITKEQNELAGRAKDAASAGVAVTAIAAGLAWLVVLIGLAF